ncbi:MAG: hypothetical protein L0Z62_08075 [Gemmataceae bacterium]|nr:hypothetical protein [Gemmataceae bacterium]
MAEPTEAARKWARDNNSTWVPEVAPEEAEINYREATPEEARRIMSEMRIPEE